MKKNNHFLGTTVISVCTLTLSSYYLLSCTSEEWESESSQTMIPAKYEFDTYADGRSLLEYELQAEELFEGFYISQNGLAHMTGESAGNMFVNYQIGWTTGWTGNIGHNNNRCNVYGQITSLYDDNHVEIDSISYIEGNYTYTMGNIVTKYISCKWTVDELLHVYLSFYGNREKYIANNGTHYDLGYGSYVFEHTYTYSQLLQHAMQDE